MIAFEEIEDIETDEDLRVRLNKQAKIPILHADSSAFLDAFAKSMGLSPRINYGTYVHATLTLTGRRGVPMRTREAAARSLLRAMTTDDLLAIDLALREPRTVTIHLDNERAFGAIMEGLKHG